MELKTNEIVGAYKLLNDAKLTKMESGDKFKVIKIMRSMKPAAEEWDSFLKTVDDKLKKENHDEVIEKAQKWQQEGEKTSLTNEEKIGINKYLLEFQKEKEDCVREELEKSVTLEFEKLSDAAFEKLVDSNDWKVNEILSLESVIKM